jgi:hypothetical protein
VFTGFVANSEHAPNHIFHGADYTAYARLGGPFNITPYPAGRDPNEIGIDLVFSKIFQHETGHVFWTLDEYESAPSQCTARSGYLWYTNMNKDLELIPGPDSCAPNGPFDCIMRYAAREDVGRPWCKWSQGQMGVVDANEDSRPDIFESPPVIEFAVAEIETVDTPEITIDLKVKSTAVRNRNEFSAAPGERIDYAAPLKGAKYSFLELDERPISPLDGTWDEIEEDVRLTLKGFPAGMISVSFRARNAAGVWSERGVARHTKKVYFAGVNFSRYKLDVEEQYIAFSWHVFNEKFGATFDVYRVELGDETPDKLIAADVRPSGPGLGGYVPYAVIDRDVVPGERYQYYVVGRFSVDIEGTPKHYEVFSETVGKTAMLPMIESGNIVSGAAPNPFRDQTKVSVTVPQTFENVQVGGGQSGFQQRVTTDVEINVYDVVGRRVNTLYASQTFDEVITVSWNGTNSNGARVPTGVYFIRARAGEATGVRKILLIR